MHTCIHTYRLNGFKFRELAVGQGAKKRTYINNLDNACINVHF